VTVLVLRLMLSGVVGRLTAQDWLPHFLLQLLRSDFFHFKLSPTFLCLSVYQAGMFNFANDWDTLSWWGVGSMLMSWTEYFSWQESFSNLPTD